jgi:hypothetical protein
LNSRCARACHFHHRTQPLLPVQACETSAINHRGSLFRLCLDTLKRIFLALWQALSSYAFSWLLKCACIIFAFLRLKCLGRM